MLKRMLNRPERITYRRLSEVCARRSAMIYAKVRLADVLPIEGSGLPEELFEFALQAHYDFVITDSDQEPLFAVEFDGPQHLHSVQVERDAKKDELSRRFGFSAYRVRAGDLFRTEWRLDRLTELTEQWFDRIDAEPGEFPVRTGRPAGTIMARDGDVAEKPSCPLCQSGMMIKNGKYGPFFSCVRFPDCKGSCDLPAPSVQSSARSKAEPGMALGFSRREVLIAGVAVGFLVLLSLMIVAFFRMRTVGPGEIEPPSVVARPDAATIPPDAATVRQMNLLGLLIRRREWDSSERNAQMEDVLGYPRRYEELSKKEASKLITAWDDRRK